MNWTQTVNTLIFVVGTVFGVYSAIHLANIQKQKLPEHVAIRLEQFAHMAVRQVEQQNKALDKESKRRLAITLTSKLFDEFHLPIPSENALSTAVESAVFMLHKDNNSPVS